MPCDVRLLGPVEVVRDGAVVTLGPPKQRTAATLLLLYANRPVPVSRFVDELWPAAPPRSAVANIRTYLSRLRAALGDGATLSVRRHESGYVLDAVRCRFDLDEFASHAAAGDAALVSADVAGAATAYAAALAQWWGEPFEGVPLGPKLDAVRAELTERRNAVLERHAEARLRLGDAAGAVARLRRHVVAEPMRESGWRLLATALYLSGNPAAALETLGHARAVLAEQLGIGPGRALCELRAAVLAGDDAAVRAPLSGAAPGDDAAAPDRVRALVAQLADELGLLRTPTGPLARQGGSAAESVAQASGSTAGSHAGRMSPSVNESPTGTE